MLARKIACFIKRDFVREKNYLFGSMKRWLLSLCEVSFWYCVAMIVQKSGTISGTSYKGNYFAYVMVTMAFLQYTQSGLDGIVVGLRREQLEGSLESMFLTATRPATLLLLIAIWPFLFSLSYLVIYLGIGLSIAQVTLSLENWLAAIITLLLTVGSLSSFGIVSAAWLVAFQRMNLFGGFHRYWFLLFSGVLFPVSLLPLWLQKVSYLIPLTYSLDALRLTLLQGAGFEMIWMDLASLFGFTIIGVPVALWVFEEAVRKAKHEGGLAFC